jgi:hypothetical protein
LSRRAQPRSLLETEEPLLFDEWIADGSDLVKFEIVPVINSDDASAHAARLIS